MSSDVDDDQVLPDSLQKLEIVPVYTHSQSACKANNERNQNPFFTELSTTTGIDDRVCYIINAERPPKIIIINATKETLFPKYLTYYFYSYISFVFISNLFVQQITKDLFGPTCSNCETNDNACGVNSGMNTSSKDVSNKSWRHRGSSVSQCIEHSIHKQIHFKHRDKEKLQVLSEKKLTILREPILKSIGRSMYHNGNHQSKSCCEPKSTIEHKHGDQTDLGSATNSTWFALKSTQCEQQGANEQLKSNCTITKRGSSELSTTKLDECQPVPGTTADANNVMIHRIQNWQLNDDSTVDFKSLVNECDNLTLSTQDGSINSITELHKTKNFQILQANQISNGNIGVGVGASSTGVNDTNSPNNSSNIHASSTSTLTGAGTSAMNSSLSSNSSNSSSCSQQARMNSSNCDVTIDELASYIEFQLHLPKPMSSNVYEAMFS